MQQEQLITQESYTPSSKTALSSEEGQYFFVLSEEGMWGLNDHFKILNGFWNGDGWAIPINHKEEAKRIADEAGLSSTVDSFYPNFSSFEDYKYASRRSNLSSKKDDCLQKIKKLASQLGIHNTDMEDFVTPEQIEKDIYEKKLDKTAGGKELLEKLIPEYIKLKKNLDYAQKFELISKIPKPSIDPSSNIEKNAFAVIGDILKKGNIHSKIIKKTQEYQKTKTVSLAGISTGYDQLNKIIGGFQKEHVIVVAARTGMGKTWFALNLIKNISIDQNLPSALFSLEMSTNEIIYRLISICSGIQIYKIQNGMLNEQELTEVSLAIQKIESSPIFINDAPSNGLLRNLSANIKNISRDAQFIIIDHIGLIRAHENMSNNRAVEVGEITRTIKIHAKEYNIPIMYLAQLNRNADRDETPKISELRESGSIEQDADIIIFLHRSDYYNPDIKTEEADVIVAKNRHGEQGKTIPYSYNKNTWIWSEKNISIKNQQQPSKNEQKNPVNNAQKIDF